MVRVAEVPVSDRVALAEVDPGLEIEGGIRVVRVE